jgi:hypothetical protein
VRFVLRGLTVLQVVSYQVKMIDSYGTILCISSKWSSQEALCAGHISYEEFVLWHTGKLP